MCTCASEEEITRRWGCGVRRGIDAPAQCLCLHTIFDNWYSALELGQVRYIAWFGVLELLKSSSNLWFLSWIHDRKRILKHLLISLFLFVCLDKEEKWDFYEGVINVFSLICNKKCCHFSFKYNLGIFLFHEKWCSYFVIRSGFRRSSLRDILENLEIH